MTRAASYFLFGGPLDLGPRLRGAIVTRPGSGGPGRLDRGKRHHLGGAGVVVEQVPCGWYLLEEPLQVRLKPAPESQALQQTVGGMYAFGMCSSPSPRCLPSLIARPTHPPVPPSRRPLTPTGRTMHQLRLALAALLLVACFAPADEKLQGIARRSSICSTPARPAPRSPTRRPYASTGTYFGACGFNKGDFGIQELASGKKLVIFSVGTRVRPGPEDGAGGEARQALAPGRGRPDGCFGNEGTGGQSFDFDSEARRNLPLPRHGQAGLGDAPPSPATSGCRTPSGGRTW